MRLEEFLATSGKGGVQDAWSEATCGECDRTMNLAEAEIEELPTSTYYRCPDCKSPLLRIDTRERRLMVYGRDVSLRTSEP
jgi:DNA-directed RNA polymerase subunit RPC12/RpoP